MNKRFIITGSQRSGTTVLKLLLNAHSQITVYDEDEVGFHGENVHEFTKKSPTKLCGFKLPMISNEFSVLNKLAPAGILFLVRNPFDVIKSMMELPITYTYGHPTLAWPAILNQGKNFLNPKFIKAIFKLNLLRDKGYTLPWYFHPECIDAELKNSLSNIVLKEKKSKFLQFHPLLRKRKDALELCSFIWKYKNEVLANYNQMGFNFVVVKYEELISNPEVIIQNICDSLKIPFELEMLEYYKQGKGNSIGNTKNDRPLMKNNMNKWANAFRKDEIELIRSICKDTAERFGYNLNET